MWLTLITGALGLLLFWDYLRKRHRVTTSKKSKITGPLSLPILGCAIQALPLGAENVMTYMGDMFEKYGKSFRFWILGECLYYTKDIKDFESILSSTTLLEKGQIYRFLRPLLRKWQKFAVLEMKSLISKILRFYEVLPLGEELKPMLNVILRSSTGINVGLRPRNLE